MVDMTERIVYQAAIVAAMVALAAALFMAFGVPVPEAGIDLQPSLSFGSVAEFVYPGNTYPQLALRFFAADSLFVLSYAMVFAGLHVAVRERSGLFAALGLGAGLLAALLDATENAFFISYASSAANGVLLTEPALPLIYVIANLKWMAAFAALYAFGLIWPRDRLSGWLLTGLMLVFPLFGILGVALPNLVPFRGLFFLLGLPLFAWHFWQQLHARA
jgi:uncharacterized membrane protein